MRLSGQIAGNIAPPRPSASYTAAVPLTSGTAAPAAASPGDISLDFADTDIRAVVAQILGNILHVNYTIDPSVQGSATLRTVTPLSRDAMIPTLQTLLAQNNAVLVQANGIYRVMPAAEAAASPALAGDQALGGSTVVPLRYASAAQLATVLQPYVARGGKIVAAPEQNALVIEGDPATRQALVDLVQAFDVDELAGQSYELFPVTNGDAHDFATAFSAALTKSGEGEHSSNPVTVVPLERIGAVLVIARAESYLADATRIYGVINQVQGETARSWHVYYLKNTRANDAAYVLQQAFTPDDVTAQPTSQTRSQAGAGGLQMMGGTGAPGGSSTGGLPGQSDTGGTGGTGGLLGSTATSSTGAVPSGGLGAAGSATSDGTTQNATSGASALLGPLSSGGSDTSANGMRIIPDTQNNAVLVYATAQEDDEIEGMLSKIDIVPLEVRIDATIAEVDLTNGLQYGTQFLFKSGDINTVLSNVVTSATSSPTSAAALATPFPGFVISGAGSDAAPLAISALQSVTKVRVLSSPELMVLDGQSASLLVGDLVPYLSQTSQETTTENAPVINSINYQETGVIMQVTPHVGSDGLVTLDITQQVSGVSPTITTTGINSPTFTERAVSSDVAIQDGQTVGLAGLISDDDSRNNEGVPFLKNVPLLGDLFSSQNNSRTREELLVLLTPHVIRDQQQALDLTADLEQQLPNAALVPQALQSTPVGGSADPDESLRAKIPQ